MPAQTTLTLDEKNKIKNAIPGSSNKIFSAALARVYYAYPDPHRWSYTGLQGAMVLSKDDNNNTLNFKVIDTDGTRGVIWEHELYHDFELYKDRNFFHSFPGDVSGPTQSLCEGIYFHVVLHDWLCVRRRTRSQGFLQKSKLQEGPCHR
jgi:hypothetical protein